MQKIFNQFINTRDLTGDETLAELGTAFQEYVVEQAALLDTREALATALGQSDAMDDSQWLTARRDYWYAPENGEDEREIQNQLVGCDILLDTI